MIYFDNASTTRVDSHILDEYNKAVECFFANPNSIHHFWMQVNNLLDKERNNILNSLNLSKNDYEIIFTSSATESNNLAIKGYVPDDSEVYPRLYASSSLSNSELLRIQDHIKRLRKK